MAPPARTITVALDMNLFLSFRQNKHTHTYQKAVTDKHARHNHEVLHKLHQGMQNLHNIKTCVPLGGVLSPTLFDIYTADLSLPRAPVQVMTYTDDISNISTHKH